VAADRVNNLMPSKNKKGKSRGKGGRGRNVRANGPPPGATSYTGPLMIGPSSQEITRTVRLSGVSLVTFAASPGSLRWTNDPSALTGWSSYVNAWAEYRVLATRERFVPGALNFASTAALANAYAPVVWYVQRDSGAPAPTSLTSAFEFDSSQPASIQQRRTIGVRAGTLTEMAFINCRSTSATWCVGINQDSLTPLTAYGLMYHEHLVQFRSQT